MSGRFLPSATQGPSFTRSLNVTGAPLNLRPHHMITPPTGGVVPLNGADRRALLGLRGWVAIRRSKPITLARPNSQRRDAELHRR